jgi:hypothetical protein
MQQQVFRITAAGEDCRWRQVSMAYEANCAMPWDQCIADRSYLVRNEQLCSNDRVAIQGPAANYIDESCAARKQPPPRTNHRTPASSKGHQVLPSSATTTPRQSGRRRSDDENHGLLKENSQSHSRIKRRNLFTRWLGSGLVMSGVSERCTQWGGCPVCGRVPRHRMAHAP